MQRDSRIRPRRLHEHLQQIRTMHVIVRKAVLLKHRISERIEREHPATLPIAHLNALRQKADRFQIGLEAQVVQYPAAVRAELDAGTYLAELRRLLE